MANVHNVTRLDAWLNPSRLLTPVDRRWSYWTTLARRSSAWR